MSRLRTASSVSAIILVVSIGSLAYWISMTNGLVSEYSVFVSGPEQTDDETFEGPVVFARLCGRVVHATGDGIANARVHLRGEGYKGNAFQYTDEEGRFVFQELPLHGKYQLVVRANGLLFARSSVSVDRATCDDDLRFVAEPY